MVQEVAGSSPLFHPKKAPDFRGFFFDLFRLVKSDIGIEVFTNWHLPVLPYLRRRENCSSHIDLTPYAPEHLGIQFRPAYLPGRSTIVLRVQ